MKKVYTALNTHLFSSLKKYYAQFAFFVLLMLCGMAGSSQLYWNGAGVWNAANTWGLTSGGPYNQTWATNSAIFDVPASTITGTTITCNGITAIENVTVTPGGTFGTGGTVINIDVANGKTFDFGSQDLSTAAGTGFIKANSGVLALGGTNAYPGGFTLNAGTLVARGVNAVGSGIFVINGGVICSNANRDLSGKPSAITVGGDFTIGATTGLASATATLTFDAPIALGAGTTRKITLGNTGNHVFNGVISGAGSNLTIDATAVGKLTLGAINTYDGLTTISAGTLQINRTGGGTLPNTNNVLINGTGTLQISSNQTLNNLTLAAGATLTIDPGVTLTINGTFFHNGGTISPTGTIAYGAGGILSYGGPTAQTTANAEFPVASGPSNLTINNANGVTLHATRVTGGTLTFIAGNFILGANDFTTSAAGGYTATQHVVTNSTGKLTMTNIGVTPTVFPIGANTTTINPIVIFNGNNVDYSARVEIGLNPTIAYPIIAVNRTWTVRAATTPGVTVNVNFFYSAGHGNANFDYVATVDHGIYAGTAWGINQTGLVQAGSYQVATLVSSFGAGIDLPMVIGNMGAILADRSSINLVAQKQNGKANLNWTINSSATIGKLMVERSADGRNFTTLGNADVAATSFVDDNLLPGINYYRIKMTGTDGKTLYSSIAAILNAASGFDIVGLLPTLVNNNAILNVTAAQKTKMDVIVTDIAGKQVQKIAYNLIAGSNQFSMNLSNLSAGTYQITGYTAEGKSKTIRFVKQ